MDESKQKFIILGDSFVYDRIQKLLCENKIATKEGLINSLKRLYPEYKRKKYAILKKTIEKTLDTMNTSLNDNIDEEMLEESSLKPNAMNNSMNALYNLTSKKNSFEYDKDNDNTIIKSSSKKNKTRLTEEEKADKAIEANLAKQTKLREKYLLNPKITFNDFGGISKVLCQMNELMFHIQNPELVREIGFDPPRGFLLHGPPGVGKTRLVEALASDLQIPCLRCGATEMVGGISGESEENIRELFNLAKSLKPCLLFIDEIDAIASKRENAAREMERRIVTQLITCLDSLSDSDGSGNGVMVIGATNRVDALDPALRRSGRFGHEISLGIPDEKTRIEIIRVLCRNIRRLDESFDYEKLGLLTPGYVGADLKNLISVAGTTACKRHFFPLINNQCTVNSIKKENESIKNLKVLSTLDEKFCIKMEDFNIALKQVQPSSKREGFATVPEVTWDDVGALESIRKELQLSILAPVKYSNHVKRLRMSCSAGILLCGPPGCGKTLLAKAIANESGINFISVKGPELLSMYVGESERAVRTVFTRAKNSKPCVIFFDEIDALCPRRSDGGESNNVTSRIVNQLLTEMDGLEARDCFILGATNRPDILDPAILRPGRFGKILYVSFPNADDRYEILKTLTRNGTSPPVESDVDFRAIANDARMEGFTGADLANVVHEAQAAALEDLIENRISNDTDFFLSKDHFIKALNKVEPSVSREDRIHYIRMIQTKQNEPNKMN